MKALLIYPEFPETYWSFKHALSFEGKRSAFPPLGLLTISAMLPDSWERRLVDMNVRPLKQRDIDWADVVLASAMIVQQDSLKEDFVNALNDAAEESLASDNVFSQNFLQPTVFMDPRRAVLSVRLNLGQ